MKTLLKGLLLLNLLLISCSFYYQNDAIIIFNGKRIDFHSPPIINENFLTIPLKETASFQEKSFQFNNKRMIIEDDFKTIVFHQNLDQVLVNSKKYFMPQKAFFYKTDWYVPLSFYAWYQGYTMKRYGRFYYVSKLLSKIKVEPNSIQLIFACKINNENFTLKKDTNNRYILTLKNTVLNTKRISQSNTTFSEIYVSQFTTHPAVTKTIIKSSKPLEIQKRKNILIIKPRSAIVKIPEEEIPPYKRKKISAKLPQTKNRSTDKATWIPSFKGQNNIIIKVNGKAKTQKGQAKYVKGKYVLPVEDVLIPFGYNYFIDNNGILTVRYGDKEEINTGIQTHKIGRVYYAPIKKLAMRLGFGLRWDYRVHTLFINPIISDFFYSSTNKGETITIKSHNEINPNETFELPNPPRLVLDIPNAVLDVKQAKKRVSNSNFRNIRMAQLTETTVRFVAELNNPRNYGYSLSDDGQKIYIHGAGKILKLGYEEQGKTAKLKIFSKNLSSFKWKQQNNQIIINFHNMQYSAKRNYYFTGLFLKKVEGLQHSWDPLTAKMVLYLRDGTNINIKKHKNSVVINFSKLKNQTRTKITPKKQTKKPQSSISKTAPVNSKPLKGKTIIVEAGHGGIDVGAVGYGKLYEKWFTLDISKRIRTRLRQKGATVLMPREEDRFLSLSRRTVFANRNRGDFYISVHLNSYIKSFAHGIETYYYKGIDQKAAKYVHNGILRHSKRHNKGIKQAKFFVLFHTRMPAVLIEPAFISNPTEYNLLLKPEFRNKIADGVVEGIVAYFRDRK